MNYFSTRDVKKANPKTSAQAIKEGLCQDGGLYLPETIPSLSLSDLERLGRLPYPERAAQLLSLYLTDEPLDEIRQAAQTAYSAAHFPDGAAPISMLGPCDRMLELWHGPTAAFKDMALQIMPSLLSLSLKKTGEHRTAFILVATSGDTGKAALEGYAGVPGVKIMVFYPSDGVSEMQKRQMTTQQGDNVYVCAIHGNFDDAQSGVKQIFSDPAIAQRIADQGCFLSSANSINWGRLVPQIVYYVSVYCDLVHIKDIRLGEPIDITVPTGNFGNIFAAYLAKRMGVPIRRLVCASNQNNILTDFIRTGVYDRNRKFYATMSPSMDILISSNLERLLYTVAGPENTARWMDELKDTGKYVVDDTTRGEIQRQFSAYYCGEERCAKTIRDTYRQVGYLMDPHTAVAYSCAAQYRKEIAEQQVKMITVSTASAYKFAQDVLFSLTGEQSRFDDATDAVDALYRLTGVPVPPPLAALKGLPVRFPFACGRSKDDMQEQVFRFLSSSN